MAGLIGLLMNKMAPTKESGGQTENVAATALVADLDGTLLRTDLLYESFFSAAAARPLTALRLAFEHLHDRARLKIALAGAANIDVAVLPVNQDVAARISDANVAGRPVLVATASEETLARTVVERVAPGVEVMGTTPDRNLKGEAKAQALIERYGERGFDYIGDSEADLSVWAKSNKAIAVSPNAGTRANLEKMGGNVEFLSGGPRPGALWKALRPHQWVKNTLIFAPLIAAHDFSAATLGLSLLAFVAFSLCASAIYILNDLLDLSADRRHPTKRRRPFASGDAPITLAAPLALGLLTLAFILALTAGPAFLACLACYLVATTAYSAWLKRALFADAVMLGGLYTLRVVAGGAATGIVLSPWLLACSGFAFLALAIVKRQTELRRGLARGETDTKGRAYSAAHLPMLGSLGAASAFATIVVLALYANSEDAAAIYSAPWALWIIFPLLIYWLGRMLLLADQGEIDDDPIVFALKDRASIFLGGVVLLSFIAASTL